MIKNYDDFVRELLKAGFSMAGGSDEGVFGLIRHSWNEEPPPGSPIRWHTEDPETDPWEWRMRVLDKRNDIAYGKFFFKKGGYITKEWYPYFLAARRGSRTFGDEYTDGKISYFAKRIYDTVTENGVLPLHEIKRLAGFGREDKSQFDRTLTELQMKMFLTMCGKQQKITQKGEEYGWPTTMFCTVESFFGEGVFGKAASISAAEAAEKITEQVYKLNPLAKQKKIEKFIMG